jgi:hypothetical protein
LRVAGLESSHARNAQLTCRAASGWGSREVRNHSDSKPAASRANRCTPAVPRLAAARCSSQRVSAQRVQPPVKQPLPKSCGSHRTQSPPRPKTLSSFPRPLPWRCQTADASDSNLKPREYPNARATSAASQRH